MSPLHLLAHVILNETGVGVKGWRGAPLSLGWALG